METFGAIAAAVSIAAIGFSLGSWYRKTNPNKNKEIFTFESNEKAISFFKALSKTIREANDEIYRSGRGFYRMTSTEGNGFDMILRAEKDFLEKRDARMIRIHQSNALVDKVWAKAYSDLVEIYNHKIKIYRDLPDFSPINVGLIDPLGKTPIIQFLFETRESSVDGDRYKELFALFIYGQPELAKTIRKDFENKIERLSSRKLTSQTLRLLSRPKLYFAYGSNMAREQMLSRCKDAIDIGPAILYGWKLDFQVYAKHYDGLTASIHEIGEDETVEGVAYAISDKDESSLDNIEGGGYIKKTVNVKMKDGQNHPDVFVYLPDANSINKSDNAKPSTSYVELMIRGAEEHGLLELCKKLKKIDVNVNG